MISNHKNTNYKTYVLKLFDGHKIILVKKFFIKISKRALGFYKKIDFNSQFIKTLKLNNSSFKFISSFLIIRKPYQPYIPNNSGLFNINSVLL